MIQVQRGDSKHFPGTFAITGGNEWRLHKHKSRLLKKGMNGTRELGTDASDRCHSIGTRTQMRNGSQVFQRMTLFGKRIRVGRTVADNFEASGSHFDCLFATLRLYQRALYDNGTTRGQFINF
jgi:hypothetical protein